MNNYSFNDVELKWQKKWSEQGLYKFDKNKLDKKCYTLVMFSYPSGDKLHVGHWYNFGPTDSWARFKRMNGFNVFEPMGFDAFGLPAENYAIKTKIHPEDSTMKNIKYMEEQLRQMGAMYDWDYELMTCSPEYYKWTQWIFTQLFKKGLAYKANAPVNWCNSCNTVLANEQVVNGACERCDTVVVKKNLNQWFFKITDYAQRLLDGHKKLDWPESTIHAQKNWIGRSEGAEIIFNLEKTNEKLPVFTTRPDTLFGVTYMVVAPEHPMLNKLTTPENEEAVAKYIETTSKMSEIDRVSTTREKTGVFTGSFAINPVNNEKIQIWTADYVLYHYGTGAVMAVPGHDERDFEFAKKFNLKIKKVILEPNTNENNELKEAYIEPGIMINSGKYNGTSSIEGKMKITKDLEKENKAIWKVQFRLKDWLVSRQRYWGAPIPIIYCDKCGEVAVAEKDLPVKLPYNIDFTPTGESPLKKCDEFINTTCPKCGSPAKRESDTMDTFVCSSWYFMRYPDNKNNEKIFNSEFINKMLPVDKYVGGPEHACMHLLYARFITMALHDMGYINFEEPFRSLVHQGIILGPDGARMSKSKGNVVSPDEYITKYGRDVFRCYLMFAFSYTEGGAWDDSGIKAIERFLDRIYKIVEVSESIYGNCEIDDNLKKYSNKKDHLLNKTRHNSIKGVTNDCEKFQFNTSIARIMELVNDLYKYVQDEKNINKNLLKTVINDLMLLIAPFAPHVAEELWELTGHKTSIFNEKWPKFNENALKESEIQMAIMINGKVRDQIVVPADIDQEKLKDKAVKYGKIPGYLEEMSIVKIIVVKGKLVNIVVKG